MYVSNLLINKFDGKLKRVDIKNRIVYKFENHRWILKSDMDTMFASLIINDIIPQYQQYLTNKYANTSNTDNSKNEKLIISLIHKLQTHINMNNIITQSYDLIYYPEFIKNFYNNNRSICFENGTYDYNAKIFRDGEVGDYNRLSTGYEYNTHLFKESDAYLELKDFLKKIKPDKSERRDLLKLIAGAFFSLKLQFYFFVGTGSNGKSVLMELIKCAAGTMATNINCGCIDNVFNIQISDICDRRIYHVATAASSLSILDDNIQINEANEIFKPHATFFYIDNEIPITNCDPIIIPFESVFISPHYPLTGKNCYWADTKIHEKIPQWAPLFMAKLIKYGY